MHDTNKRKQSVVRNNTECRGMTERVHLQTEVKMATDVQHCDETRKTDGSAECCL